MNPTKEPEFFPLWEHINQAGVTYGPKKFELMKRACELMKVPLTAYNSEGQETDPWYRVKFFDPCIGTEFYVQDYNPEKDVGWFLVMGGIGRTEWGNIRLRDLSEIKGPLGIGIEIDLRWQPRRGRMVNSEPFSGFVFE